VGTASAVKLALNQLIASLTIGFSTSLGLLQRNNVDIDAFMKILRTSALYAPTFDKKLQRMLDREYSNPNFPTKHLLKDVKLIEKEARRAKLNTAVLEALQRVIAESLAKGLSETDYSAVHEAVIDPDSVS
jgi:3-hydroxyisobutyrate dehydrogenase